MRNKFFVSMIAFVIVFQIFVVPFGKAETLSDVQSHWAYKEISTLVNKGVITGFEDGTFRPYTEVTRGQFASFLVRALQLPQGDSAFKDVSKSSKLYKSIAAAKKAGIIVGTTDGYAYPNQKITRADVAVMLDRAVQLKGQYLETSHVDFGDQNKIPLYAKESIYRMAHYGLLLGTKENNIEPLAIAQRGQAAVFVYRMLKFLNLLDEETEAPPQNGEPGSSVSVSPSEVKVPLGDGNDVKVRINNTGVPLTYIKKEKQVHIRSTDYHYLYHLGYASQPLGSLKLTLRRLDNGDTFIFTKFVHNGNNSYSASIVLPFENVTGTKMQRIDSYGTVKHEHNNTFGVNPSTHPIGLLEVQNGDTVSKSMMLSKNYTSIHRETVYANGQKSVLREFLDEWESYQTLQNETTKSISVKLNMKVTSKAISESWILLSNGKLFEKQQYIDYWFEKSILEYQSINNWLTAEGAYTKLPWSVEPGYKMAFGRNLGNIQGGIYLTAYKGSNERYFYDLVLNSVADLNVFSNGSLQRGDVPIFKTEYTSTWLKNAYGTTAPYIDTRHNENTALFLKNTGEALQIPQLADANKKYADFLVAQKEIGNIIKVTKSSHLIADYYAPGSKTTHVSLNHALGEMRFLIETYKQTKDDKYLKTAKEIKAAIEYLYPRWVRDDGDLWYQVNGQMVFNGRDYPWLTLVDLLLSQQVFEEIGMGRSTIFDKMIKTKTQYLVHTNQPIKKMVIDLLKEQGFGSLVENYPNVTSASVETEELDTLELLSKD
jgi:hypothetical protein